MVVESAFGSDTAGTVTTPHVTPSKSIVLQQAVLVYVKGARLQSVLMKGSKMYG